MHTGFSHHFVREARKFVFRRGYDYLPLAMYRPRDLRRLAGISPRFLARLVALGEIEPPHRDPQGRPFWRREEIPILLVETESSLKERMRNENYRRA